MSKVVTISKDDQRLEEANRWVLRMEEGLTDQDERALKAWLSANPQNVSVFLETAEVWDESASLSQLAELFPLPRSRPVLRPRLAWAAPVLIALTAVTFFLLPIEDFDRFGLRDATVLSEEIQQFETAIGEQSTVVLADGTVVVLNTNSQIEVAYSSSARVLHLIRGEIHVEVFDDPARPLSVLAADRIVQALGTAFSVEITQNQQIDLVVTEGAVVVAVRATSVQGLTAPPRLPPSDQNTINAGENLLIGSTDELITQVTAEEIEVKLSWREGSLTFSSEPLENALQEMERYTTVKFVFIDEDLKTQAVSGRFRAGDVEALLVALRLQFNITHEVAADGRVLLSSL